MFITHVAIINQNKHKTPKKKASSESDRIYPLVSHFLKQEKNMNNSLETNSRASKQHCYNIDIIFIIFEINPLSTRWRDAHWHKVTFTLDLSISWNLKGI